MNTFLSDLFRTIIDICIGINIVLAVLALTLGDWYLFNITILSIVAFVISRVYRHYVRKEKEQQQEQKT